jgi:formamidopyrimidine-DNA glycosylase
VLFQAAVHPSSISADLTGQQIEAIHDAIHLVLQTAIAKEQTTETFRLPF